MKRLTMALVLAAVFCICAGSAIASLDVNKELKNEGPDAFDLTLVLRGEENITDHYDGHGFMVGYFYSFVSEYDSVSDETRLQWDSFVDSSGDTINTGQAIHIGWTTEEEGDGGGEIKDMYWTDENGDRVEGSVVYNTTAQTSYGLESDGSELYDPSLTVFWANDFDPDVGAPQTMTVSNVKYAISQTRIPLAELNPDNAELEATFQDLPGGASLTIAYGDTVSLPIPPGAIPSQSYLVLRYDVTAPGTAATSTDFVQTKPGDAVPSITGWGLLVLAVLVLASGIWIVIRRRRPASTTVWTTAISSQ